MQEAGETGCKGRRPAASLYSKGLQKKKKSQLFIKEGRAGVRGAGGGAGSHSEELQAGLYCPVTHPVGKLECEGFLPTPGTCNLGILLHSPHPAPGGLEGTLP